MIFCSCQINWLYGPLSNIILVDQAAWPCQTKKNDTNEIKRKWETASKELGEGIWQFNSHLVFILAGLSPTLRSGKEGITNRAQPIAIAGLPRLDEAMGLCQLAKAKQALVEMYMY